jgi:hypothetical protein
MKYLGLLGAVGAAVLAATPAGPACALAADSFKGKRVKIIAAWPGGALRSLTDLLRR